MLVSMPVLRPSLSTVPASAVPLSYFRMRNALTFASLHAQYVKSETIETLPDGTKKAIALRQITERASQRIGRMAFEIALKRGEERKLAGASSFWSGPPKVTIIHKSNVLSVTDGLFRETVRAVKERDEGRYAGVALEEQIVDSMVYKLFREPE